MKTAADRLTGRRYIMIQLSFPVSAMQLCVVHDLQRKRPSIAGGLVRWHRETQSDQILGRRLVGWWRTVNPSAHACILCYL